MKKDIAKYVAKCPNCQQVKAEHLKTGGLTQIIEVLTWEWEAIIRTSWLVFRVLGDNMTTYGLLWTD